MHTNSESDGEIGKAILSVIPKVAANFSALFLCLYVLQRGRKWVGYFELILDGKEKERSLY